MTPTYLNSSPSPFPPALSENQSHMHAFSYSVQNQEGYYYFREVHQLKYQQEDNNHVIPDPMGESEGGLKFSIWKKEDGHEDRRDQGGSAARWMPPRMSLIRKMMVPDQAVTGAAKDDHENKFEDQKQASCPIEADNIAINSSSSSMNNPVRVCSDCNTTKTPLWRSGPRGPKSLCNACGIRQRKARRAMAAAAAAASGTVIAAKASPVKAKAQRKQKRSNNGQKKIKRSRIAGKPSQGRKKLWFEDFLISLSKNLTFHRVFPQDEKEAAILLMALSCDLAHV